MQKLNLKSVTQWVEENIGIFHEKRIKSLDRLSLKGVLERKNPYLFKAKYVLTADKIVRGIVDAHISSNEETRFAARYVGQSCHPEYRASSGLRRASRL